MKVAFYLENGEVSKVDLRYPEKGNPGIGGSEYQTVMVANELSKRYGELMEVSLLAAEISRLPAACRARPAATFQEAAEQAADSCVNILVFGSESDDLLAERILSLESHPTVKGIAWVHKFLSRNDWDLLERSRSIAAVVNVGREQLDFYRDHPLFYKSAVIYNSVVTAAFEHRISASPASSRVVYLGSLVQGKGFDLLAEVWPNIVAKMPDAELHVVGSGRLYGRDNTLGSWGIADPVFEAKFIPFLLDEKGSLLPSVKFHGILGGTEKHDMLASAAVGVVNPTGETETFCTSAVEFEALRVPVVSAREWGLLDTVKHGRTGLLCRNRQELISNIVKLLENHQLRTKLGEGAYAFAKANFQVKSVASDWKLLLDAVEQDRPLPEISIKSNVFYRNKLLKEILRRLKLVLPVLKQLRPIEHRGLRSLLRFIASMASAKNSN
jgi:glycosyltransferase involved in cell wall biosynthesis